jgi:hypothetical protein
MRISGYQVPGNEGAISGLGYRDTGCSPQVHRSIGWQATGRLSMAPTNGNRAIGPMPPQASSLHDLLRFRRWYPKWSPWSRQRADRGSLAVGNGDVVNGFGLPGTMSNRRIPKPNGSPVSGLRERSVSGAGCQDTGGRKNPLGVQEILQPSTLLRSVPAPSG